ncbi:MAG: hypothetical protein QNJ85_09985 [Gammaproteobacteria bacterium]|nr:hypothetical protein [Gammaproteobacteria bacterium]
MDITIGLAASGFILAHLLFAIAFYRLIARAADNTRLNVPAEDQTSRYALERLHATRRDSRYP